MIRSSLYIAREGGDGGKVGGDGPRGGRGRAIGGDRSKGSQGGAGGERSKGSQPSHWLREVRGKSSDRSRSGKKLSAKVINSLSLGETSKRQRSELINSLRRGKGLLHASLISRASLKKDSAKTRQAKVLRVELG